MMFEHSKRVIDREEKRKVREAKNTSIEKILRYTAKKVLWLINYSLSFSKKDTRKEIGIKVLGCFVMLQSVSLSFFIVFSLLEMILLNPLSALGLFILTGAFIFKEEIKSSFNLKVLNRKKANKEEI